MILLALALAQTTTGEIPSSYAASIDDSFEAMRKAAHVYCGGGNETPCIHEQAEAVGWVKEMIQKGAWSDAAIRDLSLRNTRNGSVNWVGVKAQASAEYGAPNQPQLDAANAAALVRDADRKRARSTTTECRTYVYKRGARSVCTSY